MSQVLNVDDGEPRMLLAGQMGILADNCLRMISGFLNIFAGERAEMDRKRERNRQTDRENICTKHSLHTDPAVRMRSKANVTRRTRASHEASLCNGRTCERRRGSCACSRLSNAVYYISH